MAFNYTEKLNVSIYAVMVLRLAALTQDKVSKKLNCNISWVRKVESLPKYKDQYSQIRKDIADAYLTETIKRNPEENLSKWYPVLLDRMHKIATGTANAKQNEVRALKELLDLAKEYREKEKPEEDKRPLMSDEKAEAMHEEVKILIKLHKNLIGKVNAIIKECPESKQKALMTISEISS